MNNETMKTAISDKMNALIKKHELEMYGEPLEGDVFAVTSETIFDIVFNDEYMAQLISGNVASSIYDEFEKIIDDMNCELIDLDGNCMTLKYIDPEAKKV